MLGGGGGTNRASGAFVTEVDTVLDKDQRVTNNGDGTLTVLILATGNATVYDENGTAIARNPGQIRYKILLDHNGTPRDPPTTSSSSSSERSRAPPAGRMTSARRS